VRYIHRNPVRAGITESPARYKWSSHNGYISQARKWSWLNKHVVLKKLFRTKKERIRKYSKFVNQEDKKELLKQLESARRPSIMGSKSFIEKVKARFFTEDPDDEIPESKVLAPDIEMIKKIVVEEYGIDKNVLLKSKRGTFNEPRNVAIYLTRILRFDTLSEIGSYFNLKKYSTVSSVTEQMKKLVKTDRKLCSKIEKLKNRIINSQKQT
jgi:chromosomal replication initiation ATPase DnaA